MIQIESINGLNSKPNLSLISVPFSRKRLTERTSLQSNLFWKEGEKSVESQSPLAWRCKFRNNQLVYNWLANEIITA